MRRATTRLAALLLATCPALAMAGVTGEEVRDMLHDLGYKAHLATDAVGDPQVRTAMGGLTVFVNFYGCEDGRCSALQFECAFDIEDGTTYQAANDFNARYRFGRVHLDHEMDPYMQFDFEMDNTQPAAFLESQVATFESLLGSFRESFGV
jgi:hypothetical protein